MKILYIGIILLAGLGFADASFLTYEHYTNAIPPCSIHPLFSDCGIVLKSSYATVGGVPLALIGIVYYACVLIFLFLPQKIWKQLVLILPVGGFICSLYFVYLQLFVIHAICIFCFTSAIITTLLLVCTQILFPHERKYISVRIAQLIYRYLAKPILFKINPETVHKFMTNLGNTLGTFSSLRMVIRYFFYYKNPILQQSLVGINFNNPIGLAAGFDYEAQLTQIVPAIGFGFETIGTITRHSYEGNPRPMLGRLPQSKSLMVNKGFKNLGAYKTIKKLSKLKFELPLGVSIGRTNKNIETQKQAVEDIVQTFMLFEKSSVKHSYYELNISCPNLFGNISFYDKKNLDELLTEIDKLTLSKPLFIKMPIEKTDTETYAMLEVIAHHTPVGVIFGNLQKNRTDTHLVQSEVAKYPVGNFSGKPTFERSNHFIKLTYKKYHTRFIIIGCGGVFNAADAYHKICLGASLVQLITGMIFNGPQLITQINMELSELLKKDGFSRITEAIGSKNRNNK